MRNLWLDIKFGLRLILRNPGFSGIALLVLARGTARQKELAVRLALGCSRRRLLRQLIVEGLLLSALGTVVGFFISVWGNELLLYSLKAIAPMPIRFDVEPHSRVFLAMLGFCLLSTLLFSAGPAWRAVKHGHANRVQEGAAEDATGRCGRRLFSSRNLLIVGRRITFRNDDIVRIQNEIEVVGVVPTLRDSLRDPHATPNVYVPFEYGYRSNVHFHVKMTNPGPPAEAALMPLMRRAIQSADGNLPVLLAAVSLWATGIPARRAARVDPLVALRLE